MSTWTESRINVLITLVRDGWSSSQIGEKLRVSRNAVIGKTHRLGLNLSQIAEDLGVKKPNHKKRAKPKPWHPPIGLESSPQSQPYNDPVVTAAPLPEQQAGPITLMDLKRDSCRWPLNDGNPFIFCGQPCDSPPYCPEHFRKAYSTKKS